MDSGDKKQEAEEEGGSDLRQDGRHENGAEGGVARRQSPEDPEYVIRTCTRRANDAKER